MQFESNSQVEQFVAYLESCGWETEDYKQLALLLVIQMMKDGYSLGEIEVMIGKAKLKKLHLQYDGNQANEVNPFYIHA
ncbi:MAG: hypothetical protein AB4041_18960 [Microcystaceae cyanobacterium]